jgi:hypothetical protein
MGSRSLLSILAIFAGCILISGCSGTSTNVVTGSIDETTSGSDYVPFQSHQNQGWYLLEIDTAAGAIDVIPQRTSSFHLNTTGIMNSTMGVSAAGVPGEMDPPNGIFTFDITLTHPLGSSPQFAGFDVKGILITPGSYIVGPLVFADVDETRLENADGYTRWWNPTEFTNPGMFGYTKGNLTASPGTVLTATINPYKYFADHLNINTEVFQVLGVPLDDDEGRGVFRPGSSNTRRYKIQFKLNPGPKIIYGYAIDASWKAPDVKPPGEIPDDFPIEANQPEAYDVVLDQNLNTMFYDYESGLAGGLLRLEANVYDWQGIQLGDYGGQVEVVRGFLPDAILSGGFNFDYIGDSTASARYFKDFSDQIIPTEAGEFILAVRAGSMDGPNYNQGFGPAPDSNISAWQVQTFEVRDPSCEPDNNNTMQEAVEIQFGEGFDAELCDNSDTEDWYWFEIPDGFEAEGFINFWHWMDSGDLELYNEDGDYIIGGYGAAPHLRNIDFFGGFYPPGKYYIRVVANQVGNPPPAGSIYYLEMAAEPYSVEPTNPADVTLGDLSCTTDWISTRENDKKWGLMTSQYGLHGFYADTSGFTLYEGLNISVPPFPAVHYPYLYYWENPGLVQMVDWTESGHPVLHENVMDLGETISAMTMNSENLYIVVDLGSESYCRVYDIASDPMNPSFINQALVEDGQRRLALFDPEGPDTQLVAMTLSDFRLWGEDPVGSFIPNFDATTTDTYYGLAVEGDYACVTWFDSNQDCFLKIYKHMGNGQMQTWGQIQLPSITEYLDIDGTYAYVGCGEDGIIVVDFQTFLNPVIASQTATNANSSFIHVRDDFLFAAQDARGVALYNLPTPVNPVEDEVTNCLNYPVDGVVLGNWSFFVESSANYGSLTPALTYIAQGTFVYDPLEYTDEVSRITGYDDLIAVGSTQLHKIWVYQFTTNPLIINEIYTDTITGTLHSMEMTNQALYVSDDSGFLHIYDTKTPPAVIKKPDYPDPGGTPFGVMVADVQKNRLFATRYNTTNYDVWDIIDPFTLTQISGHVSVPPVKSLDYKNEYLYVCSDTRLVIWDCSGPGQPVWESTIDLPDAPNISFIQTRGAYTYVSGQGTPITAVDVFPPDDPTVLGQPFPEPEFGIKTGLMQSEFYLYGLYYGPGLRMYQIY